MAEKKDSEDGLVLTFDVGTQSLRAILVRKDGSFADYEKHVYRVPYLSKKEGWAEQTPDFYYDVMMKTCAALLARNQSLAHHILAVTITVFRDSAVFLDENNQPLRNIVLWLDQRRAKYNHAFQPLMSMVYRMVGMYDTAVMQYEATPANWVKQNEPAIYQKTRKYVMLPTYLVYRLTGVLKDSAADQTGHIPMDYKNKCWLGPNGINTKILQVPLDWMPEICKSGEVIGPVTDETAEKSGIPAGTPVIVSAPDKACETLGLGVNQEGLAAVSLGTAATVDLSTAKYVEPFPFLPSYPACDNSRWNPDVQIYRGFWMLKWLTDHFGGKQKEEAEKLGISVEQYLDESLQEVPAGSHGLLLEPYWQPGLEDTYARGTIIGFTDSTDFMCVYRAIIEGIGLALRKGLKQLEKRSHTTVHEIRIAGGGSRSDAVCQIMADLFHLPVRRMVTDEASGLGAAINVFISLGVYESFEKAIASMVHEKDLFVPDEKQAAVYDKLFDIYEGLHKRVQPITRKLSQFE